LLQYLLLAAAIVRGDCWLADHKFYVQYFFNVATLVVVEAKGRKHDNNNKKLIPDNIIIKMPWRAVPPGYELPQIWVSMSVTNTRDRKIPSDCWRKNWLWVL